MNFTIENLVLYRMAGSLMDRNRLLVQGEKKMKNRSVHGGRILRVFAAILLTAFLSACQTAGSGRIGKTDPATLKPGLAVLYYYPFWGRHLDTLFSSKLAVESGKPGKPIPYLNHDFKRGYVFGSGKKAGIGVPFDGFLRMSKPG